MVARIYDRKKSSVPPAFIAFRSDPQFPPSNQVRDTAQRKPSTKAHCQQHQPITILAHISPLN